MAQIFIKNLIKCLVDTVIAIEHAEESNINDDFAVALLEQISSDLQKLSATDKKILMNEIENLIQDYPIELNTFLKNLPSTLGI